MHTQTHAVGEATRAHGLSQKLGLQPHVGDKDGSAIASDALAKKVGEFARAVWDVIPPGVSDGNDDLLKKGKGLVDVLRFDLVHPR